VSYRAVDETRQLQSEVPLAYGTHNRAATATVRKGEVVNNFEQSPPWHVARRVAAIGLLALLGACSHLAPLKPSNWHAHWPWHHPPAGPAPLVNELVIGAEPGQDPGPLPETWNRNNLRVDLTGLAGEGEFTLRPVHGHDWPMRIEFLVHPGAFGHLEVRGDQRVVLAAPADGALAVLVLPQGVYVPATETLRVHFGT
jgi:hypothetical protein